MNSAEPHGAALKTDDHLRHLPLIEVGRTLATYPSLAEDAS